MKRVVLKPDLQRVAGIGAGVLFRSAIARLASHDPARLIFRLQ